MAGIADDVRLLALRYERHGDGDVKIGALARDLSGAGLILAGVLQINAPGTDDAAGDMDVQIIGAADGSLTRISEARGASARGCRLDAGALQQVAHRLETALRPGLDLLILSKFGRQEAEGLGLRGAIAAALDLDIRVLVGVRADHVAAFAAFAGHLGAVTGDVAAARTWALRGAAVTSP